MLNLSNAVILSDEGALPAKYQRIAEIIRDYDPKLELAWIPPGQRTAFDKEPFAIFHNDPRYLVGTFSEAQMDHRIIAHLFKINNANRNVLSDLEAEEAALRAINLKEQMDQYEEQQDFAKSLITSKKNYYRHNGKVYQ